MHLLSKISQKLSRGEAVVAGCLSGTSADGLDVVLARFPADGVARADGVEDVGTPEVLAFATRPFPPELESRVRRLLDDRPTPPGELAAVSRDLGSAFGAAVRGLAGEAGVAVDLVGSHGQTVFHHDGDPAVGPATLQLGNAAFLAEAARAPVVHDFRQADLAAGGEGAPLSGLADPVIFGAAPRPLALLNLGGMANLTILPRAGEARGVLAFDTGPAGSLLDGLARRILDRAYDPDGIHAARGTPSVRLLDELCAHPFFDRPPPKSTGRDTFGEAYVDGVLRRARDLRIEERGEDLLATAVEAVARIVAEALERFVPPEPGDAEPGDTGPSPLVLCGGGGRNRALVHALERRLAGRPVVPSSAYGVDPDAREALVFAVLAARFARGVASTDPASTGARSGRVLGSFTSGPPELGGEDGRGGRPRSRSRRLGSG